MEIDKFAAAIADRVIVTSGLAIVAAGAVAKADFVNESGFFQVAQRVIDGCVTDAGQTLARRFEDVAGGRMIFAFEDHLKHRLPLRSQFMVAGFLFTLHSGLRLILNLDYVKWGRGLTRMNTDRINQYCCAVLFFFF